MKSYLILSLILCICMLVFPFFSKLSVESDTDTSYKSETDKDKEESTTEKTIDVMRSSTGSITTMDIFEYLVGTVAGEMPASFHNEALKAQAVVSYTYAKWLLEENKDEESYITDLSSLHQKYIDKAEQKEKWQDTYEENRKRIEDAVKSVYGEFLTFDGKAAMTVFHALSSGKTLSSEEVWGDDVPYLVSVDAPGDIIAEEYESTVSIPAEEFRDSFEDEDVAFEDDNFKKWASVKEKSDDGYISVLTVSSCDFTARQVRKILSLPGNCFRAKTDSNGFVFTVHGKGHGVGMSQYSADYLARQGKTYREILNHFYPGTTLTKE